MSRVREALRRGRRDLHREMSVPALYIAVPNALPIPCTVRPQDLPAANGRPFGAPRSLGLAQETDVKPTIVFIADDAPAMIRVNAIVSVEPGEAYRIGFVHPPHGLTIAADVVRLSAAEAASLPVPDGAVVPTMPARLTADYVVPGYRFIQANAAAVWTVTHNLNRKPIVAITDDQGNVVDAALRHLSDFVCEIDFDTPMAGEARCA